jgi:hypothetical protein
MTTRKLSMGLLCVPLMCQIRWSRRKFPRLTVGKHFLDEAARRAKDFVCELRA